MPTPLARLLRALGGGQLSPQFWSRVPRSLINCTRPTGPDFDLPIRWMFDDLTPEEDEAYQAHLAECDFCRTMHEQALKGDWSEVREIFKELGINVTPRKL